MLYIILTNILNEVIKCIKLVSSSNCQFQIIGFMVKNFFGNEAIYALVIGGVSFFVAAALVAIVKDVDDPESAEV